MQGVITVEGPAEIVGKYRQVLANMGLFVTSENEGSVSFAKNKPNNQIEQKKESKLAIGFKTQNEE